MSWLFKLWRGYQRRIDMQLLWPACKKHAPSLDYARAAFYLHVTEDTAWTRDYSTEDLQDFVEQLK